MRNLEGRVAVVTGAAGGIGKEICRRLAAEGMRIAALDLNESGLSAVTAELNPPRSNWLPLTLDITNHDAVKAACKHIDAYFGAIDVLVNNAGWDQPIQFLDTDPAFWSKVISINLLGPLNLHHAALPIMARNGGGKVVNISSDAGRVGSSGESVYSACKGGLIAFTKTLARECAGMNICLNTVCPGPTDTPLLRSFTQEGEYGTKLYDGLKRAIPLKRLGQPDDIPGIVAFLSSNDADFITGQVISVSGGLTMHG
ncbi:SDR family oxidoreductase [Ensifer sp. ENS04]|uniref:SDR family oxidoreductase n=1 Tax=Ensifer sp. ENS04 TaxID=2769281 RepID=UPI00178727AF|nr:SDR family oxidoreductase [Ensifer sp. ENS04]MBD9541476.1 SDR family oxidoreductase [Ensifer sp. ENS04]